MGEAHGQRIGTALAAYKGRALVDAALEGADLRCGCCAAVLFPGFAHLKAACSVPLVRAVTLECAECLAVNRTDASGDAR